MGKIVFLDWLSDSLSRMRPASSRFGIGCKACLLQKGSRSGVDIKAVQFGWPLGLPFVDHLGGDIWEVRVRLESRIARVLFATEAGCMVLLHGFIKKDRKTPKADLDLAHDRLKRMRGGR